MEGPFWYSIQDSVSVNKVFTSLELSCEFKMLSNLRITKWILRHLVDMSHPNCLLQHIQFSSVPLSPTTKIRGLRLKAGRTEKRSCCLVVHGWVEGQGERGQGREGKGEREGKLAYARKDQPSTMRDSVKILGSFLKLR